jgi:hypothetical protein
VATYKISFVDGETRRVDEEIEADTMVDSVPFVDFKKRAPRRGSELVARYRQDEIRRVLRAG